MELSERIRRRRRKVGVQQLVRDYSALSPVAHPEEPSGRGPVFERLLDHLEPVFDGQLPPNGYLHGPSGSGKSAVVTSLFEHLAQFSAKSQSMIHTSTRSASPASPSFVYIDLRGVASEFAFYHDVLDGLVDGQVPHHGVSTDEIRDRLHDILDASRAGVVVGVDHVGEPDTSDTEALVELFAGLPSNVTWLAVGQTPPNRLALTEYTARSIRVERYQRQMLVDVVMSRASEGLAGQALDHTLARRIADWAEGDAHDALAALFTAADRARQADRTYVAESDVTAAIEELPRPSVSLARVLQLPTNKQTVLRELVTLDPEECESVTDTAESISNSPSVDLSAATVERYLYEIAELGIVERVQLTTPSRKGRPPSRIELRFPPTVFRRLFDLRR
jgi:Cdc6-like AAA superfamily ATPase